MKPASADVSESELGFSFDFQQRDDVPCMDTESSNDTFGFQSLTVLVLIKNCHPSREYCLFVSVCTNINYNTLLFLHLQWCVNNNMTI